MVEYWDIYNRKGKKKNKIIKRGQILKNGEYHIVVEGWVRCAPNEFIIQKRSPTKKLFPNRWYCSFGGSVLAKEDPQDALIRESMEELSLDISNAPIKLKRIILEYHTIFYIYLVDKKVDIKELVLQEDEVSDVKKVKVEEIFKLVEVGEIVGLSYYDKFFSSVEKIEFLG
ncbi:NUDIX hydrolase [Peptoniphilus catoniae]|uniref:NUDIX hydrolase n=1 Tax=Peptoniphilus catoniae TaxID=1660341 RepID=UPI0015D5B335|nr:NUDIX domain-containing protein [Peptoniphilus catoniae]